MEKSAGNFPTEDQMVKTPSVPDTIRWIASAPTASRSLWVRWTTCALRLFTALASPESSSFAFGEVILLILSSLPIKKNGRNDRPGAGGTDHLLVTSDNICIPALVAQLGRALD